MGESTPAESYTSIHAPLLVLRGDASPLSVRRAGALVAHAVAGARLETIAGAGHMGPLTHRDPVNERIAAHIHASES
jgi:pimeloyl-ACP methyl ester carboxylesterase